MWLQYDFGERPRIGAADRPGAGELSSAHGGLVPGTARCRGTQDGVASAGWVARLLGRPASRSGHAGPGAAADARAIGPRVRRSGRLVANRSKVCSLYAAVEVDPGGAVWASGHPRRHSSSGTQLRMAARAPPHACASTNPGHPQGHRKPRENRTHKTIDGPPAPNKRQGGSELSPKPRPIFCRS
jgi:hypothetical protein